MDNALITAVIVGPLAAILSALISRRRFKTTAESIIANGAKSIASGAELVVASMSIALEQLRIELEQTREYLDETREELKATRIECDLLAAEVHKLRLQLSL